MGALIHVTAWERTSPWRRVLCALGRVAALLLGLTILLELLGPPVGIFLVARWEARKVPEVMVTAVPLRDYSVSEVPGQRLSYLGYSFEVPWTGSFTTKGTPNASISTGGMTELEFASGERLLLIVPKNQKGLLTDLAEDHAQHLDGLRTTFGSLMNRSAYDQYSALLNTSPATVRAFGPRSQAVRAEILLTIKAISMPASLRTGAFAFHFPDIRGFQIGDPQKSKIVLLEIFGKDGYHLEIVCGTSKNAGDLTQAELNRILETIHRS